MRPVTWIGALVGALLMAVGAAIAQRPEVLPPEVFISTGSPLSTARSPLAVTERVMSFDANKDHRVSRDELPDRMQGLIARGDKNADAALDLDEIRALVNAASSGRIRIAFRPQPFDGLPGVISDLKLSPAKREQALAILSAHEPAGDVSEPANSDLYKAMKSLLDDEEYDNFVAAATRLSKTVRIGSGVVGGVVKR